MLIDDTDYPKVDVIITLGYPANSDGTPSPIMRARVEKSIELYEDGYAPYILFTGKGRETITESYVMVELARTLGVPETAILQDNLARDTIENAKNSITIMQENKWHSAIVVTSPYHTKRAKLIFDKYDIKFYMVAAQSPDDLSLLVRLNDIVHEFLSYLGGYY